MSFYISSFQSFYNRIHFLCMNNIRFLIFRCLLLLSNVLIIIARKGKKDVIDNNCCLLNNAMTNKLLDQIIAFYL